MLTTTGGVALPNIRITKLHLYNDALRSFKEHISSITDSGRVSLYFIGYSCRNEIVRRRDAVVNLMAFNGSNGIHSESAYIVIKHLEDVCKEINKRRKMMSVYNSSTFTEYNREIHTSETKGDLELNPLLITIYDFNVLLEESRPDIRLKACKLLHDIILFSEQVGIYIILCERGLKNIAMLVRDIQWYFESVQEIETEV